MYDRYQISIFIRNPDARGHKNCVIGNSLITRLTRCESDADCAFPSPFRPPSALAYCAFSNEKYGSNTDYMSTWLVERNCDYYTSCDGTKTGYCCSIILKTLLDRWQTNLQRYACAIYVFVRSFNWISNNITAIWPLKRDS